MIAAFLSDAHGNPVGLEACLRIVEASGAERVFFLGDAVGYFPEENAVLDLLKSCGAVCIRGNHEALLLGELSLQETRDRIYRLTEAKARLTGSHRSWLSQWPNRLELDLDGVRVLLVHGSPDEPLTGYVYEDSNLSRFGALPFDLVAMGHTHRPFTAQAGAVRLLNPGSCGMPRDVGHLAACALFDTVSRECRILRVPFDAETLLSKWGSRIDPVAAACLRRSEASGTRGMELA